MKKYQKEKIKKNLENQINFTPNFSSISDKINYENLFIAKKRKQKKQIKTALCFSSILIILLASLYFINIHNKISLTYTDILNSESFVFYQETNADNIYTFENLIDLQYNKKNQINFYKATAEPIDNFYTCAYIPTENYQKYLNIHMSYENNYFSNFDFINLYKKEVKENTNLPKIQWLEYYNIESIPPSYDNYSLILILKSQNINIVRNESTQNKLNIKKRLYINTYYQIINNKIEFIDIDNTNIITKLEGTYIWALTKKEVENKNKAFSFSNINANSNLFKLEKINTINCVILPLTGRDYINDNQYYGKYYNDIMEAQLNFNENNSKNYGYFDYNKISKILYK